MLDADATFVASLLNATAKEPGVLSHKATQQKGSNQSDIIPTSGINTTFLSSMKTNEPFSAHIVTNFPASFNSKDYASS